MKVLLVDDEKELLRALKSNLEKENFTCDACNDPIDAKYYVMNGSYDIIVLDIMMPKMDGFEFLKYIRSQNINTPVLFLSAKSDIEDKLKGLDLGADDYLTKPFSSMELVARLKAIIRRNNKKVNNELTFHDLTLNLSSYKLSYRGKEVSLINKEFQIMELFMLNPNATYSTNEILEKVWNYDTYTDITTVWTFLSGLRKKIGEITSDIKLKSNRGVGYSLVYEP